jgi:hypothetical protein
MLCVVVLRRSCDQYTCPVCVRRLCSIVIVSDVQRIFRTRTRFNRGITRAICVPWLDAAVACKRLSQIEILNNRRRKIIVNGTPISFLGNFSYPSLPIDLAPRKSIYFDTRNRLRYNAYTYGVLFFFFIFCLSSLLLHD